MRIKALYKNIKYKSSFDIIKKKWYNINKKQAYRMRELLSRVSRGLKYRTQRSSLLFKLISRPKLGWGSEWTETSKKLK